MADGGISWVLKLTSVPSISKNNAYLCAIVCLLHHPDDTIDDVQAPGRQSRPFMGCCERPSVAMPIASIAISISRIFISFWYLKKRRTRGYLGYAVVNIGRFKVLYLDLNLDTAGEFELHQGVDGLGGRAVDVDQTLVV